MSSWIRLCHSDELPEGSSRGFDPLQQGQDSVLLVRWQGQVHAYRDACPHHQGTPMAWRKDAYLNAAGNRIVCHAHGAQFDMASGVCTLGPCLGQSLQRLPIESSPEGELRLPRQALISKHGDIS
ncbi:Rieske (2Fe-2S) protein [Curvibacter sp. HBC61]|uniref:Rieske (2Fe-2S) protein n=1 Tax=Curvibacter cyanobacteriorum TaxID=3026422 RepID=A0ABT5N1H9_9BURK|nr:Rieske (2Fe-2S) protein [Curvibacter sp. HBC61]MDD0838883.1 Rieske (2Fe-2S) protein [Curvibacter sp. HBC61]